MFIKRYLNFTIVLLLILLFAPTSCKTKYTPPAEVALKYKESVQLLCNALTDCIKEEVAKNLADDPSRKEMVLSRINKDLCIKEQVSWIGELSVDPAPAGREYNPELYTLYSECASVVSQSTSCKERKELHQSHPACKKVRSYYEKL